MNDAMNPTGTELLVCQDIADRQTHGRRKYGTTVEKNPLTVSQWAQHAYEESIDMPIYLKRLKGAAEQLERAHADAINERNRWFNLCCRLENALRAANNAFCGDAYGQRVIDEALEAFIKAKNEMKAGKA